MNNDHTHKPDLTKFYTAQSGAEQEIQRLTNEEAVLIGKISQLKSRLEDVRLKREGISSVYTSGKNIASMIIEAYEEAAKQNHEDESKENK